MENKIEGKETGRIRLEKKTVDRMIRIYCNQVHKTNGRLCEECVKLNNYAQERLDKCPFGDKKTVCSDCRIHCYKSDMKEKVKAVMRYSGPRMIFRHPYLSIMHLIFKNSK